MGASLTVDTGSLGAIGTSLKATSTELTSLMTSLETKMGTITGGWKDAEGAAFAAKFQEFMTEAKNINSDLDSLGVLIESVAKQYYDTVKKWAGQME